MLVRYFMTHNVITLSPGEKCVEAFKCLQSNNIRRAPVMDRDRLVGIVSERDLYRVLPQTLWQASEMAGKPDMDKAVKNIMTTEVHVLNPNDHLEKAARLMLEHKIGGIPVLKDGKMEGIITESDIFKAMWGILSHRTTTRILFFDKGNDTDKAPNDYIKLCLKHHCIVNTFISHPRPYGGHMHYLCIKGAGIDDFIKELWSCPCDIMFVEKNQ